MTPTAAGLMTSSALGLGAAIVATVFVVALILLFERRRAREIESDLRRDRSREHDRDLPPDG